MSRDAFEHLQTDPLLGPVVETHGPLDLDPAPDPFERLVVSIVNQQLSTASAAAIRERLFDRCEISPAGVLAADEETLREVGLSGQKIDYLRSVARAFQETPFGPAYFAGEDDEQVIEELTEIRGVGVWTAKMFCMFCLGRPDVFPVEDLGIRNGVTALAEADLTRAEVVERAEPWRPYRSYACLYVWRDYEA